MITITERAAAGLEEMLRAHNAPPGQGVKLVPGDIGGFGMTIDTPSDGDEVIRAAGEALLIVDGRIAGDLDGVLDCGIEIVDVVDGGPRARFRLVLPSEES